MTDALTTGSVVLAYNAAMFLSFVLSGLGMYLLARDLTGNRWAALAAGTVFLAAPYRFLHVVHIQLLTLQWFPFVFWCLVRYLRDGETLLRLDPDYACGVAVEFAVD